MRYIIVFLAIIFAVVLRVFVFSVYKVPSHSMAPTLVAGDYVFASRTSNGDIPERGAVVTYFSQSKLYIKRVVAVARDEIVLSNNILSINGLSCVYSQTKTDNSIKNINLQTEVCPNSLPRDIIEADVPNSFEKIVLKDKEVLVLSDYRQPLENVPLYQVISTDQIISKPLFVWMSYSTTQDFILDKTGVIWNRILTKIQ